MIQMSKQQFSQEYLAEVLDQIVTGQKLIEFKNTYFLLKSPTPHILHWADIEYKKRLDQAIKFGLPREEFILDNIYRLNFYTEQDENQKESLEDKIRDQLKKMKHLESEIALGVANKQLQELKQKLYEIEYKKLFFTQHSAENKAEFYRKMYILYKCTMKINGEKELSLWDNYDKMLNHRNQELIAFLNNSLDSVVYGIPLGVIRYLARGKGRAGSDWRAKWISSIKTGSPIFPGAVSEWDINKISLCRWSTFYDNVFEHPDCPSDSVIDNDDLLDQWVEEQSKENKKKRSSGKFNKKNLMDYDDVIVYNHSKAQQYGADGT